MSVSKVVRTVPEKAFVDRVKEVGRVDVICTGNPARRVSVVRGGWRYQVTTECGSETLQLATHRSSDSRIIKSVATVFSMLADWGVSSPAIPSIEGLTVTNTIARVAPNQPGAMSR
ncbi:hypothetical protein V8J82_22385 [Gymnodinialimonas sp. 2305UL16-5]|uniref:hypothetical protein n=1 Tax=Gymnodinialimonas mytili TaxID=3126503 RepID=UPI0030A3465D